MKQIYATALTDLQRRIETCVKASKVNRMQDCGWSNKRAQSYWLAEMYKATYKFEKISQRLQKGA